MAARVRDRVGREEQKLNDRTHRANLSKLYGKKLGNIHPGEFLFRFWLIRGAGGPPVLLDPVLESVEWTDAAAAMTGSLSLRRPVKDKPGSLPLAFGHRVRCEVRWRNAWFRLWTMRAGHPEADPSEGTVSVELADDLILLGLNKRDWEFRTTKRRKKGWFAHEIAAAVARREGLKIGHLVRGKKRIRSLVKKQASGLDVIRQVYKSEKDETGNSYIIRLQNGKLEVVPLKRNPILYVISKQITAATVTAEQSARPVTVLKARGKVGKGDKARKVRFTYYNRKIVGQFGYVAEEKDFGRVSGMTALKRLAKREIAKHLLVKRTAQLTVPGIPFIHRGDGLRWVTTEAGWFGKTEDEAPATQTGDRSYAFVTEVHHAVSAGEYTMDLSLSQLDPFIADEEKLAEKKRKDAKRARDKRKAES